MPTAIEDKRKHLEMCQAIITRLAGNSSAIKGWAAALATGVLAYTAKGGVPQAAFFALVPVVAFASLDGYYLGLERNFRTLYGRIAQKPETEIDYVLKASWKRKDWWEGMKSPSVLLFYIPLFVAAALVAWFGPIILKSPEAVPIANQATK